eukprot:s1577_g9.t1
MSILAMLATNTLFHAWFEAQQVPIQPLSFVDDWQLLLQSFRHADYAIAQLQQFCDSVDLTLDHRKTFAWSLDPEGRRNIRASGVKVVTNCRTLGAHMQLSRQHTNKTLQQRVSGLIDMWDRLRLSPSPYKTKALALVTSAWPRGLHGVAATGLSAQSFSRLRSGAMRGLGADSSGASPWIHLGMVETPDHDPAFWSIVQTLRCARECGSVEWILPVLLDLAQMPNPHCFSCTILTRCHSLGWRFTEDGFIQDSIGSFCLFRAPMPEIWMRAEIAWQSIVWQAVSHRPGFHTLSEVDAPSTRRFLASLSKEDAGMMRTILNGTHFTSEAQQYWVDDVEGLCPYCQCTDSRFHRFWQCEAFRDDRSSLTAAQWDLLPTLPETLTCYGWVLRAPSWKQWHQTMAAQPIPEPLAVPMPLQDDWLDLFTDGSCLWPQKRYRLAAWAVVQATPDLNQSPVSSKVLAAGALPGLLQSAYRAELYGVFVALKVAQRWRKPVRSWCDCKGVIDGVVRLLARSRKVRVNGRHADLWTAIAELLNDLGDQSVQITKVAAHQDTHSTVSGFEAWCFLYNGLADQAAQLANLQRSEVFWKLHRTYVAQTEDALMLAHALHKVMLQIRRRVLFHQVAVQQEPTEDVPSQMSAAAVEPCPVPWRGLPSEVALPCGMIRRFGFRILQQITSWLYHALERVSSVDARPKAFSTIPPLPGRVQDIHVPPGAIKHILAKDAKSGARAFSLQHRWRRLPAKLPRPWMGIDSEALYGAIEEEGPVECTPTSPSKSPTSPSSPERSVAGQSRAIFLKLQTVPLDDHGFGDAAAEVANSLPIPLAAVLTPFADSADFTSLPLSDIGSEEPLRCPPCRFTCNKCSLDDAFVPIGGPGLTPAAETAEVWHPIEELCSETDESLPFPERLFSAPAQSFRADTSEGFQGCYQVFFGPWILKVGGKHIAYLNLMEKKALARSRRFRLAGRMTTLRV